jgi:carotenoid 1,2-hydratase
LLIDIDERTAPLPRRLRGQIRLEVEAFCSGGGIALDAAQNHFWQPLAPVARVEVSMERPQLRWSGPAYLDSNFGARPLEQDFIGWTWARATHAGQTTVTYDVTPRDGGERGIALRFDAQGRSEGFEPPPRASLPTTGWGIQRSTRCDAQQRPAVRETLEDGPFYARSLIDTWHDGQSLHEVHESLSLTRFASRWVQVLLPVRMPRRRS